MDMDRKLTRRAFMVAGIGGLSLVLAGRYFLKRTRETPGASLDRDLALYRNPAYTLINQAGGRVRYRTGLSSGEIKLLETDLRGAELIGAAPTLRGFNDGKRFTVGEMVELARVKFPDDPRLRDDRTIHQFVQQAIEHGVLLASSQRVYIKGREPLSAT